MSDTVDQNEVVKDTYEVLNRPVDDSSGQGSKKNDRALSEKARSIQLDFLCGTAILLVLGHHMTVDINKAGMLRPFYIIWANLGWSGVDLFFVLSGFLIGGLLFREITMRNSLDVKRFIIRRGFRIWPLYYMYLTLATLLAIHQNHSFKKGFETVWTNWIHLQNYTVFGHSSPLFHTWSLSLEEHFYLALPLVLLLMIAAERRKGGQAISSLSALPFVACLVMLTCLILRFFNQSPYRPEYRTMTQLRIDGLFFGVLLAYFYEFRRSSFEAVANYRWWLLAAGLLAIAPFTVISADARFTWTIGFTELYLGYGLILVAVVSSSGRSKLTRTLWLNPVTRLIAFIGFYSYPIYLFHIGLARRPEQILLNHIHGLPPVLQTVVGAVSFVIFAVTAGFVIGKTVEKPTLMIRDKLFPARDIAILHQRPASLTTASVETISS